MALLSIVYDFSYNDTVAMVFDQKSIAALNRQFVGIQSREY
jgi:hypothetical protein